jgi:hypothetical protein
MPTMNAGFPNLLELQRRVEEIAETSSPSEVFTQLHQACRWAAPRAALFLIRKGQVCGWNSSGYDEPASGALRALRSPIDDSCWVDRAGRPEFGQPPADEQRLLTLTVRGRPIAFVLAERCSDQEPWFPEALHLLVSVARMRLELDLALRKLEATVETAGATPSPETSAPPPPVEADSPPGLLESTTDFAPETTEIDVAESPDLAAARRYARLVATDIRLYHEEAVMLGQREGDLVQRLGDQLGLGKQTFLRRHGDLGPAALELLREAYVQVLAAGKTELIPSSILD